MGTLLRNRLNGKKVWLHKVLDKIKSQSYSRLRVFSRYLLLKKRSVIDVC